MDGFLSYHVGIGPWSVPLCVRGSVCVPVGWMKHGGQCVVAPSHRPFSTWLQASHDDGKSIRTSLIVTFSIPLRPSESERVRAKETEREREREREREGT